MRGWRRVAARFRPIDWLAAAGVIALLVLGAREVEKRIAPPKVIAGFAEAIDGDSLRLAGVEVRLMGVDAPELSQWCQTRAGRDYACGVDAKAWLRRQTLLGAFSCAVEGRDRFGRALALCSRGDLEINREMVRQGQAVAFGRFASEEAEAKAAARGVWAGAFQRPADWRREREGPR
jgi:endonuclease YncB( thermonuclease family)